MSKQYLAQHTIDDGTYQAHTTQLHSAHSSNTPLAHPSDIYSLACTPTQIISASGSSTIKIHSISSSSILRGTTPSPANPETEDDFPIAQVLSSAHPLGVHHLTLSSRPEDPSLPAFSRLVSVGFGGEAKVWTYDSGKWNLTGEIEAVKKKAGELWAVALSQDGSYLVGTTGDGRVCVWDLDGVESDGKNRMSKIREYETKGSFGLSIDLSPDGRLIASGHESGAIYLFSTATSRMVHSLPTLVKPVRAVKFSPGSSLLAAAGDARIISLYDPNSGEQVANLSGHGSWITTLDWSLTGQYLVSGGLDGKVKVWDIDRRTCVATHSESEKGLWAVKWLPKGDTTIEKQKAERFATAGSARSIAVYREATGG